MIPTIVIIGGGCSGTLVALNLLKATGQTPLEVVILEARDQVGRGLAYTVPSDRCKLNVPAHAMGAFAHEPQGFLTWLRRQEPTVEADQFVSRRRYGEYLQALVSEVLERSGGNTLRIVTDKALDLSFDEATSRFRVKRARGDELYSDACILALGNIPRTTLNGIRLSALFSDPYREETYQAVASKKRILVVGTGLTAVDSILEAEGRGYRGDYVMLSRHARIPLAHEPPGSFEGLEVDPFFASLDVLAAEPLPSLVRRFRREAQRIGSSQPVINAMRSHIQQIWSAWPVSSKRRFLRHLRPFWEVHRHRIPEAHAQVLDTLRRSGRLRVVAGRLESAQRSAAGLEVRYRHQGEAVQGTFDMALCCAGPESDLRNADVPLIQNLLRRGIIQAGSLGLGIDTTHSSLSALGQQRFKILGPLQREQLWEITAVREIRSEAERIAKELELHLSQSWLTSP